MFVFLSPSTSQQWDDYFDLRWRVLRAPCDQLSGSERDDFDESSDRVSHVAAYTAARQLVGVGRIHFNSDDEAQIRYMAVEAEYRGQGIGLSIVNQLETFASERGARQIVLNARAEVVDFYERLGYRVIGPGPTMFDDVRHQRMAKNLSVAGKLADT